MERGCLARVSLAPVGRKGHAAFGVGERLLVLAERRQRPRAIRVENVRIGRQLNGLRIQLDGLGEGARLESVVAAALVLLLCSL